MDPSVVISLAALLVSLATGYVMWRVGQTQNELQRRLLVLEETRQRASIRDARRAELIARVQPWGNACQLVITNRGAGAARNVQTFIDDTPILEHAISLNGADEITTIGPGAEATYGIAVGFSIEPPVMTMRVALLWQDDSGEAGTWVSQLAL